MKTAMATWGKSILEPKMSAAFNIIWIFGMLLLIFGSYIENFKNHWQDSKFYMKINDNSSGECTFVIMLWNCTMFSRWLLVRLTIMGYFYFLGEIDAVLMSEKHLSLGC